MRNRCATSPCRSTSGELHSARRFDVVGFTLQYDLCYTGVLTMLDLAAFPWRRRSGRPAIRSSSPAAPARKTRNRCRRFIDLFVIGDGEEALPEVCDA
jgi:radical SAM superfamily enzyme YgiQ (UPF0313 family)